MAQKIPLPGIEPGKFLRTAEYLFGTKLLGPIRDVALSVAQYRSTAVASCHASGKTYGAARIALTFLLSFPDALVITTAPTWHQVERVLWGEIHAARLALGNKMDLSQFPDPNLTAWKLGPQNYIIGLSTDRGVRLQGFHGRILIVLDEAAGIQDDIYEAIEGIRSGGDVRVLALGNPTVIGGRFYDAFDSPAWNSFYISAFDTPNFKHPTLDRQITLEELLAMSQSELNDNPHPYLITRWWVAEKFYEWGPQAPMWSARVLGQFPEETSDSLFSMADLDMAARDPDPQPKGAAHLLRAGLDVAGPGENETVLTVAVGSAVQEQRAWSLPDPRWAVLEALESLGPPEAFEVVNVDSVGIGYHVATFLRDAKYPVVFVNAANRSLFPQKFANFKAEMYWAVRTMFREHQVSGLLDAKTRGQLETIRYQHKNGKIAIESKEDMRKRGVKSPDYAESFVLSQATAYSLTGRIAVVRRAPDASDYIRVQPFALDPSRW